MDIKLEWFEEQLYSVLQLGIEGLPPVGDSDTPLEQLSNVPLEHNYISMETVHFLVPDDKVSIPVDQSVPDHRQKTFSVVADTKQK